MTVQGLSSGIGGPPAPAVTAGPASNGSPTRPARGLIGWMAPGVGELMLASNRQGVPLTAGQRDRLERARLAVDARAGGVHQQDLVSPPPAVLDEHVSRLRATPAGEQMFREGYEVALVDLGRVVAFQPHVFTDTSLERTADLDAHDLAAIAELTLPTAHEVTLEAQCDPVKQAWMIISPNPNLRVAGPFNGDVNGLPGFGFVVAAPAPFVQVVRFEGRYILRDGYHRAFGLLRRGITRVPAFLRDFETVEQLAPPGMLPHAAWLGLRPPLLRDYHDDAVSADLRLPTSRRMIVISALELMPNN